MDSSHVSDFTDASMDSFSHIQPPPSPPLPSKVPMPSHKFDGVDVPAYGKLPHRLRNRNKPAKKSVRSIGKPVSVASSSASDDHNVEESDSNSESQSSDQYSEEEEEVSAPTRRSTRLPRREPPKEIHHSRPAQRSTRSTRANVIVSDDSDIVVVQTKPTQKVIRQPRGIQAGYGVIRPIVELNHELNQPLAPQQNHRPHCAKCNTPPAHILQIRWTKTSRKPKADEDASFSDYGGWTRCMQCSDAYHWKCISATQKQDILKASRILEDAHLDDSNPVVKRKFLDFEETTDFVCDNCQKKEAKCLECHQVLNVVPLASQTSKGSKELYFRCTICKQAAHYPHLKNPFYEESTLEDIATHYQDKYNWRCDECASYTASVDKILAWKHTSSSHQVNSTKENTDPRGPQPYEYLVKWRGRSYNRLAWVSHLWLASTSWLQLKRFRETGPLVKLDHLVRPKEKETGTARRYEHFVEGGPPLANPLAEKCVPGAWKTIETVMDVWLWEPSRRIAKIKRENSKKGVDEDEEEIIERVESLRNTLAETGDEPSQDLFEIPKVLTEDDVELVVWGFFKYQELEYEEAVWDSPPKKDSPGWPEFVDAFRRLVHSQEVKVPRRPTSLIKDDHDRSNRNFHRNKMEIKQSFVHSEGKELRDFQVDGVQWLTAQWWFGRPAILSDEMGGKTVQVITFLSQLVRKGVYPHLIIVPNSTVLNWMREFQRWAPPDVRAVAYFGRDASRRVIQNYELFHQKPGKGNTRLKLHVLVTTPETINSADWITIFKEPSAWEVLVVDEAQRLKSNAGTLVNRLKSLVVRHYVLMTGTPLNNNLRELFNLLNFVDPKQWANLDELELQYQTENLSPELVSDLHARLKTYFLRRTKEILNLPAKVETLVPVSMTVVQKKIYKSIFERDLTLLKNLLKVPGSKEKAKTSHVNLRNVLMQTRKCIQHPYLVDPALEPSGLSAEETHRQLTEASGKLKVLQLMLADLKARGRRVLLFSQFVIALDIIEDFLVGEGYKFLRLDGDLRGSLRQKDIDTFNAPDSDVFIYILSTRAGGVGINLATADTVIIFDPDFNPHQDAQAIARAHRFGQKKPVIVFRLMSTPGAEVKIVEQSKKKLVLDHIVVQSMEEDEPVEDLSTMLLSGVKALWDEGDKDTINYSANDIKELIDKSEEEAIKPPQPVTATGLQFEFAKTWETINDGEDNDISNDDADFWAKLVANAEAENIQVEMELGRGAKRRAKATVNYQIFESPQKAAKAEREESSDFDYAGSPKTDIAQTEESGDDLLEPVREINVELMSLVANPKPKLDEEMKKKIINERRRQKRLEAKLQARMNGGSGLSIPASTMPVQTSVIRATQPLHDLNGSRLSAYVCQLCDGDHHESNCPLPQSIEGLRGLRLKAMRDFKTMTDPEDIKEMMDAINDLEETIIEQERELTQKKHIKGASSLAGPSTYGPASTAHTKPPKTSTTNQKPKANPKPVQKASLFQAKGKSNFSDFKTSHFGSSSSSQAPKRPSDGHEREDVPPKRQKVVTKETAAVCVLCKRSAHPVPFCSTMNMDSLAMKRRLEQLARNQDPDAQQAINALRERYKKKIREGQPPKKFINLIDLD